MQHESINRIVESMPNENIQPLVNAILAEVLISAQKVQDSGNHIKSKIISHQIPSNIGPLLLLCIKLEEINCTLTNLKREYNL